MVIRLLVLVRVVRVRVIRMLADIHWGGVRVLRTRRRRRRKRMDTLIAR